MLALVLNASAQVPPLEIIEEENSKEDQESEIDNEQSEYSSEVSESDYDSEESKSASR